MFSVTTRIVGLEAAARDINQTKHLFYQREASSIRVSSAREVRRQGIRKSSPTDRLFLTRKSRRWKCENISHVFRLARRFEIVASGFKNSFIFVQKSVKSKIFRGMGRSTHACSSSIMSCSRGRLSANRLIRQRVTSSQQRSLRRIRKRKCSSYLKWKYQWLNVRKNLSASLTNSVFSSKQPMSSVSPAKDISCEPRFAFAKYECVAC